MTTSSSTLEAGALIASRYRAEDMLHGEETRRACLGTDEQTGQRVMLIEIPANDAGSLGPVLRVTHAHLAKVVDILQVLGTAIVVVEHVPGITLESHLGIVTHEHPVEAVRTILRVADAVAAIHNAGGAHGGLRPDAIVFEPVGRAGPVVTFAPALLGASPYRSPVRGGAGPPSAPDDAWAVAGLLWVMLTGKDPPITGVSSEADLGGLGIRDALLRSTLARALSADASRHADDLRTLKRDLARWFVDHAGEEPSHAGPLPHGALKPPPLPPAAARPVAPPVSAPSAARGVVALPPRRSRTKLVVGLALGATVLGLGAAWGVSALRKPPVKEVLAPGSASAAPERSAHAIALGEVPVKSAKDAGTGNTTATCVAGYLPKGAFIATPSFDWLCAEADPRLGADRLRNAIVHGGNQVHVTDAMKLFSRIGWYDMPVYAIVRGGCCPDAKPIELPAAIEPCPDMGQALRDIAKAVLASQSVDEPLERYTKSANCEISANRSYIYKRHGKPLYHQEQTFRELLKAAQTD